ncbi:MAG: cupin domain-containing protein [Saprospiraceae bacterium]|jgi:mannose-6-phosphate isomerase-like protein (cupin superfamily)|nr:cupin domain-containing protein [Saprospiraceae bacterium]
MPQQFPFTIETKYGEKINFLRMEGARLLLEGFCTPMAGPGMHTHLRQDEGVAVVKGTIGYQILGEEPRYAGPGDSVTFKRGVPHRFWNAGDTILRCTGWIDPAESIVFFLSSMYEAINRGENHRPETFDGAYLSWRYRREYDMSEIPGFVKKVIIPATYFVGLLLGKYGKFKDAPKPK